MWSNSSWEVGRLGSQKAWGWEAIEDKWKIMTSQVHLAIKGIKDTPHRNQGCRSPREHLDGLCPIPINASAPVLGDLQDTQKPSLFIKLVKGFLSPPNILA